MYLYMRRYLKFKADSERYNCRKLFKAILYSLRVLARYLLRENWCRTNIFLNIWNLNHSLTSNRPIHYLLDYGDYKSLHTIRAYTLSSQCSGWLHVERYTHILLYCQYLLAAILPFNMVSTNHSTMLSRVGYNQHPYFPPGFRYVCLA